MVGPKKQKFWPRINILEDFFLNSVDECQFAKIGHDFIDKVVQKLVAKGQLISECLLGVIDFPKNQRKIWQISALESKKWSNQQSKSTFLL